MGTIKVSNNSTTNNNTLVVNFTIDISNVKDILLSKDGGETYISATSFTNTSAFFDISDWSNGTYTDCMLKCIYSATATSSYRINNVLSNVTSDNEITSINKNSEYRARITANTGYVINKLKVTMGETVIIDSTEVKNYVDVHIPNVTGDINITCSAKIQTSESNVYSVTNNLTNCTNSNTADSADEGSVYSGVVFANPGYSINEANVTMSGVDITKDVVTDESEVSVENNYINISYNLSDCSSSNNVSSVIPGNSYSTVILPDSGYELNNISVIMGGVDITSSVIDNNFISISSVVGELVITASGSPVPSSGDTNTHTITYNLTNCVSSNTTTSVSHGVLYATSIGFDSSNYNIKSIQVTMGGVDITSSVRNGYNLYIPSVTGDLVITAVTERKEEVKIALYKISNMVVRKGETFNILYSSNISAVKHEFSWDGGNTFWDKTNEILVDHTVNYKYTHNADTEYDLFNMAIRVTDKNGNTDIGYFTITFKDNEVEDNFAFTQYKRLNNGILVDCADDSEALYHSTVNMNEVTAGANYTININLCNYICICYYDKDGNYVSYSEDHTDDWSIKGFSTTITIPSNIKYIRACVTNDGSKVVGTLTESTPVQDSDLLDSTGAYVIDDFSGTSVDENKWGYELGYVRNGESQRYTNSNAEVNNGILALRGLKDSNGNWTSSSIISKHHFAFMYGKIVARIKPCNYNGAFGAFWTLGDSFEFAYNEWGGPSDLSEWWPWCGEFDIMEFYNHNLTCGTFFGNRQESGRIWYNNYDTGAWHEFGMEWLENGVLIFTIDGNEISRTSPTDDRAFHIPHFILLNQAIGASGGTPDSNCSEITQYVDWVKYYPASTENLVLNSSDFELIPGDFQGNHCILRLKFNDNCINKSVNWSSSNSSIISVHNGLCAAVGTGDAIITATSQSGISRSTVLHSDGSTVSIVNGAGGTVNNILTITQEPVIENVQSSSAYSKYQTFFDNTDIDNGIVIPGLKSTMIPQGMCKYGDFIYVSAYDSNGNINSCIYVIRSSTGGLEKTIWLKDNRTTVGGLATDGSYLYIASSTTGKVGIVSLDTLNSSYSNQTIDITYVSALSDANKSITCSYCTYDTSRNLLWVGIYNRDGESYAYGYETNGTNELTLQCKINVPAKTQGLFFVDNYVYFSTSYGRNNTSNIRKCIVSGSGLSYTHTVQETIEVPPTSENIFIENNKLYILFGNAASYYYNDSSNPTRYAVDRIFAYNL